MANYSYRLLNVFAESTFGGNPLCVFEDARGMDEATMQALTVQFNLSETAFLLPSEKATARVRVFTPGKEMRFAGHPALGSAHVAQERFGSTGHLTLEFPAGVVSVELKNQIWSFVAPHGGRPKVTPAGIDNDSLAECLGLTSRELKDDPVWVDTGSDQLLIPVCDPWAVEKAQLQHSLLDRLPSSSLGRKTAFVFAVDDQNSDRVVARYFYAKSDGSIHEDPGTGSACANLGGWLLHKQHTLPLKLEICQGDKIGRPCRLNLEVKSDESICVGGKVLELGRGTVRL